MSLHPNLEWIEEEALGAERMRIAERILESLSHLEMRKRYHEKQNEGVPIRHVGQKASSAVITGRSGHGHEDLTSAHAEDLNHLGMT